MCLMLNPLTDFRKVHGQLTSFLSKYSIHKQQKSQKGWNQKEIEELPSILNFKSPANENICRFEAEAYILRGRSGSKNYPPHDFSNNV